MKIEEKIKLIRENAGLKNKEFAESIGISEKSSYNYEKDASKVQLSVLKKIVEIYNVDLAWLVTGDGDIICGDLVKKSAGTVVPFGPVVEDHIEVVKKFEDHETALLANEYLLNMEKKSSKEFHMAVGYLKGVSDSLDRKSQGQVDRRKKSIPFSPDRRKKVS